jgi:outer membrane protein assembly factor BamB
MAIRPRWCHPNPGPARLRRATLLRAVVAIALGGLISGGCSAVDAGSPVTVRPIWATAYPTAARWALAAPLSDGESVIGVADNIIGAYDARTGARRWQVDVGASGRIGATYGLASAGGLVLAASYDLVALDTATRSVRWSRALPNDAQLAPVVTDGQAVFVGGRDGWVQSHDLASGALRWSLGRPAECRYQCLVRGLARSGDTLYVAIARDATNGGSVAASFVRALRASDGAELWRWQSDTTAYTSAPTGSTVVGDLLVSGDVDGRAVFAVHRFTGALAWRTSTPGSFLGPVRGPGVSGDTLFVGNANGDLLKLRATTGQVLWRSSSGQLLESVVPCGPVVLASNGFLYVRGRAGGEVRNVFRPQGDALSSEIRVLGTTAFVAGQVRLYAFECSTL